MNPDSYLVLSDQLGLILRRGADPPDVGFMTIDDLLSVLLPARALQRDTESLRRSLHRLLGPEIAIDLTGDAN